MTMPEEPPVGSVVLITSTKDHVPADAVYQHTSKTYWRPIGAGTAFMWGQLTREPSVTDVRVLYTPPVPEPPEDSLVLIVHQYGAVEVYWRCPVGWYQTASTDPITWGEVTDGATRVVVLSVKDELKVNLD